MSIEPRAGRDRECPPLLPFVFAVGITGHRKDALAGASLESLQERLRELLALLAERAALLREENSQFYSAAPPRLLFVSPLADGADQIGAEIAVELGYELHAILPFARERYRAELPDAEARHRFDSLLARATCVLELPGNGGDELHAYVMAGRATVAHCDLLVAVWDGLPPRGRGGTGEVVELAFARGTPIAHLPVHASQPPAIRWSAFEPAILTAFTDPATVRPLDEQELGAVLAALLAPPPDPAERRFISDFQKECRRRLRPRIEYPLLLAAAGVSRVGRHHWREDLCAARTRSEWQRYCEACASHAVSTPLDLLEQCYEWADTLAGHFAQSYRSGHVFNFVLAAVAVLLALSALLTPPEAKKYLVSVEFVVILAILANTWLGNRNHWHRRWLDYRQLAERLRPMRSLKLLGIAAPDPPGTAANPTSGRWIEWYAAAVWRAMGCPHGRIDHEQVETLAASLAHNEIEPQTDYHRATARQVERLDRRLEYVGYAAFGATLLSCVTILAGLAIEPRWVSENLGLFTLLTAGLPAIGTAMFGIRVQGDFAGNAVRSEQTALVLERIAERLTRPPPSLTRAADLAEEAARAMLADLDEWRLLNEQHDLSVG